MKQIVAFTLALSLFSAPAVAQDEEEGIDLMQEGAELLLRGLMNEMEPAIDDLEFLPNGDIIIRRSPDAPPWDADVEDEDNGQIEL